MNDLANSPATSGAHVQWLADWHKSLDAVTTAPDDAIEEPLGAVQELSVLLATTPASTPEGLIAQIEWFKEDLGDYVLGNASSAHDMIFDTLIKSVQRIGG